MAYDEGLVERIEELLPDGCHLEQKKMFGGLVFLDRGNMAVGVSGKGSLMVRVGKENYEAALARKGAGEFIMNGKPLAGWLRVDPEGFASDTDLDRWIGDALEFTSTLPAK